MLHLRRQLILRIVAPIELIPGIDLVGPAGLAGHGGRAAGKRRVRLGLALHQRVRLPRATALLEVALFSLVLLTACGGTSANPRGSRTQVVASIGIIADFAKHVAGPDADVSAVVPGGADVHSYSASTADARRIARADLVLVNGYGLEAAALDLIAQNRRSGTPVVPLAAGLEAVTGGDADAPARSGTAAGGIDPIVFDTKHDPHLWLDAANAIGYVEHIRDALIAVDGAHADGYRQRADAYIGSLRDLDAEVRSTIGAIPPERRTLIVFHDAFQYFARAYGLELVAAVLPASANQQTSAQTIADLTRTISDRHIPAVYAEPQFSSQVLRRVADASGAQVLALYSDALTGDVPTYIDLMRANARAIRDGLGR